MLWVVSQRLIEKHGYLGNFFRAQANEGGAVPESDHYRTKEAVKSLVPKHGNPLSIQLVLNSMKLQSCSTYLLPKSL
ncbi:hypothetical protein BKA70DRAFT_682616, partial [Coprinopsis sp. MPI-PUGE-AT-0042]